VRWSGYGKQQVKDKKTRFTALLHHYYGVPTNGTALLMFRFQVGRLRHRTLSRRSQNAHVLWARMRRLIDRWLPPARTCHPYPLRRMGVIT